MGHILNNDIEDDECEEQPGLVLSIKRSDHQKRKAEVQKPCVVGYFSIDKDRHYTPGLSHLKYMTKKTGVTTNLSLNGGKFDKWKKENINKFPFFDYLLGHKKMLEDISDDCISEVGFVTDRSTLMDIFRMSFEVRKVFVTRLCQGNIYIRSVRNPHEIPEILSQHGHKFEQHMLSDDPNTDSNTDETIVESEEFTCVFEMAINHHYILYSSETDGILANTDDAKTPLVEKEDEMDVIGDLEQRRFVRVMTSAKHYKDNKFRRYKTPHIWPKLFFSRSDKVIIGNKNEDGFVTKLWGCSAKQLMNKRMGRFNPNACFRQMDAFFTYVKDNYLREIVHEPHDSVKDVKSIELIFIKDKNSLQVEKCDETPPPIGNIKIVRKVLSDFSEKLMENADSLNGAFETLNISNRQLK